MPVGIVRERKFFSKISANFLDRVCSGSVKTPVDERNRGTLMNVWGAMTFSPAAFSGAPNRNFDFCPNAGLIRSIIERIEPPAPTSVQVDNQPLLHEFFGDLHGVQRGAFEKLIARDPETESVIQRAVLPNAADLAIVFFGCVKWHRILLLFRVIHQ